MNIPHNISPEQAQRFTHLYAIEKKPLRACAAECGIDIIGATMLAQQSGCLRFTEAIIVNSKAGEQGRMGEELFQQHLPNAVNCNTSVQYANPSYDFILNGLTIDVKCSAGFIRGNNKARVYALKVGNVLKVDCFVLIVKSEHETENLPENYTHCFIIPSIYLLNNNKLEIRAEAIHDKKLAWSEFCYPIEQMAQMVNQIADNRALFTIPDEIREAASANRQLKKEVNNVKRHRNRATS